MASFVDQIEHDGFAIIEAVLSKESVSELVEALSPIQEQAGQISGGVRNLMSLSPLVKALAASDAARSLVEPVLGPNCFPVRAILFDKTPDTNWKIPWHQDVTIAVKERVGCEGYGPWSVKAAVVHVQPPAEVSERMLSVRLHLDDCPASNGALRVLPATHTLGKLKHAETDALVATREAVFCEVGIGGALLMRPLLLHASSESSTSQHRRVIHLDFAAYDLPCGMQWIERST
jgi:ectoine hydroxylase-related dioxygenase (phytanoyl-CoA dioxygenase family)